MEDLKQKIDALKLEINETRAALRSLERAIAEEKREAAEAIDDRHAADVAALRKATWKLENDHNHQVSEAASHPWEGKTVYRLERVGFSDRKKKVYGVVEVRRIGTPMPGNARYSIPDIGKAFVRSLKADGTPGLKIDSYSLAEVHGSPYHWYLEDEGELK